MSQQKLTLEQTLHEIAKFHFILDEGRKGHHLLFSPEMIRDTFLKDSTELRTSFQTNIDEVNKALNETFNRATFEEKRDYIRSLAAPIQHAMIFGYFQLLEGQQEPESKVIH